ncbi:MAG: tetraacyldisaccharide 4'-kinase [Megasphaera sp.]|jgi:tetraacyldisaccharide 4'-kinase|uniref:tetraacyldisaccharide 4'-kinase n=1 Tax=Megasphaera sueciensis TaxID=349094 RepID=UPI003D056823|nr:tetraacyldisaccharide 4'-kinase [Megasphaera sp.]MCI1822887.1 tetraacyldisaccharide 4'-kinase [Megasphaera sp.]
MSFRSKTAAYFSFLMQNVPHTRRDRAVLAVLEGISKLYGKGVEIKYKAFAGGKRKQEKLPAVVIGLGNITIGGTGKTPTACMLARIIQGQGYRVALLNRGYRSRAEHQTAIMSDGTQLLLSAAEGGDEACLMARSLPGVPVLVGRERTTSGRMAIERYGAEVLILDDAFQHWPLIRDLDIVLIDATNPFGNGYLLPRGILREPLEHLNRAGLFIITKTDQRDSDTIEDIYQTLRRYNTQAPIIEAVHQARWCVPFLSWSCANREDYKNYVHGKGRKGIAVSALGNPASFERTVKEFGYELVDTLRFDDHHQYTAADIERMTVKAKSLGAILITTEKDAVKIPEHFLNQYKSPLYVLGIEIEITKGQDLLYTILHNVLGG